MIFKCNASHLKNFLLLSTDLEFRRLIYSFVSAGIFSVMLSDTQNNNVMLSETKTRTFDDL